MSLRLTSLALLALALLVAPGCDSTDDGDDGPGATACVEGSMTATTDGVAFAAECVTFTLDDGALGLGGLTNPDGDDGSTQRQIVLVVPNAAAGSASAPIGFIGTYVDAELSGDQIDGTSTTGLSGTITLTTLTDDRAAGTFSFSGSEFAISGSAGAPGSGAPTGRTVAVTGGTFDIRR